MDGACFQCRYVSFWMGSCLSLVPGARGSMMIQSSAAELPASGFWSPSFSNFKTTLLTLHRRQKKHVSGEITPHPEQRNSQRYI